MSSSDDDSELDSKIDLQTQMQTLIRPLIKKQKKVLKRLDKLEALFTGLVKDPEKQLPALKKNTDAVQKELTAKIEALASDSASYLPKASFEALKQEHKAAMELLRSQLEDSKTRTEAQKMALQGITTRVDLCDRKVGAVEEKVDKDVAGVTGQLHEARASTERSFAEMSGRLMEASDRSQSLYDGLMKRVTQECDHRNQQAGTFTTKDELAKVISTSENQAAEASTMSASLQAQLRIVQVRAHLIKMQKL